MPEETLAARDGEPHNDLQLCGFPIDLDHLRWSGFDQRRT
jgi:hypothetical protein